MGFGFDLSDLPMMDDNRTVIFTAENPNGEPGKGGSAEEGPAKYRGAHLGVGWKYSPFRPVAAGEKITLVDVDGPGSVRSIWFADCMSRQVILRIWWDGQEHPSVECPLMEFFAYSWRKKVPDVYAGPFFQVSSLPVAVNPNRGFNCFWPMPFRKHCRIEVENRSKEEYLCFYRVSCSMGPVAENAGYFHAQFRRSNPVEKGKHHVILDGVSGKGRYVGTALFVQPSDQPGWWGEGEMKMWVDEDGEFPSLCGTGTEDYFGGAYDWQVEKDQFTYSTPFMGMHQLIHGKETDSWSKRYSMYRWHITDPVSFRKSIRVELQNLGWEIFLEKYALRSDDMASVAYWYQTLPSAPFPELPSNEELCFD